MKFLLCLLLCMLVPAACADDEILYWMVDDQSAVHYPDGTSVSMPDMVPHSFDTTLAARVRVVGGNITEDVFLNVYEPSEMEWYSTELGIDFADVGGRWGVGNPTGMQSALTGGGAPDYPYIEPVAGSPEYSFIVEIGNYDWTADTWTTVAQSIPYTRNELESYIHYTFDLNPPSNSVWNPRDFYASVPEPNAGMLALVGMSLLLLRRRKA